MKRVQFHLPEPMIDEFHEVREGEGWPQDADLHRAIWLMGWNAYQGRLRQYNGNKKTAPGEAAATEGKKEG